MGSQKVKPFWHLVLAPTCSEKLITGLGKTGREISLWTYITHLVESIWEAQEALKLFPGYNSDAEIYERAGIDGSWPFNFLPM
mgnify:CR=1 FL=1